METMAVLADNNGMSDDLDTTAPQSKPVEWVMPEPVFRRTSGKLPSSFVKDVGADPVSENSTPPAIEDATPSSPPPNPISEPRPKSPVLKIVVVLLGLSAMVAFLIVFLSVVYYFFLWAPATE